jgi:glycosyltransferase involved in cell wall biosynthesis
LAWEAIINIHEWRRLMEMGMSPEMRPTGVFFNGPVYGSSGYADENLHVVLNLASHGIPVQLEPRGARSDTGKLLSAPIQAQLDALTMARVDPWQSVFFVSAPAHEFQPEMYHGRHTVGRTTFETDRIPEGWRERCNALDEIWVPSHFNLETFARAGVAEHKLHVLQEGVDTEHFRPGTQTLNLPGTRGFNFLSVFDWQMRKGYDILLRAYCAEFRPDEDVALILKVSIMNQPHAQLVDLVSYFIERTLHMKLEESPNIILLTGMLPHARFPQLYASADAFVLPTRGEGWGRPYMEALACGRPVIATRWGGQMDFLNDDNADLIELDGIQSTGADIDLEIFAGHRWAEPSADNLRQLLRRAVSDRDSSKRKAARGLLDMREKWDWRQVVPKWAREFDRLLDRPDSQAYLPSN